MIIYGNYGDVKNLSVFFFAAVLLLSVSACRDGLEMPDRADVPTVFTASIELDTRTKTVLAGKDGQGNRAVLWGSGDAIAVGNGLYCVSEGVGTADAIFTGSGATRSSDGKYRAYYPAGINQNGTLYLPETQYYVPGRIDHLPMYAESEDTDLIFKNICSVLQFDLICREPLTVGKIVVQSRGGKKLSGTIQSLSIADDGSPSLTMSTRALTQVTLDCGVSGVALGVEPTSFHVAIPAQEYAADQLQVFFYDTSDKLIYHAALKKDADLEFSTLYEIGKDLVQSMTFVIATNSTVGRVLDMPFLGDLPAKLKIDWGDGTPAEVYESGTAGSAVSHRYEESRDDIPTTVTITSIGSGLSGACLPRLTLNPVGNQDVRASLRLLLRELNTPLLPVDSKFISEAFYGCSNLTEVCPDLFARNPQLEDFTRTFQGCTSLTSIPSDLFSKNLKAKSFGGTFNKCKGLTGSLPADLFVNNPAVTNFSGTFQDCTGLTGSIPVEMFAKNPAVTSFRGTFMGCSGLSGEIPADLFVHQSDVEDFAYVFQGCSRLTGSIPPDLFAGKPKVTDFQYTFAECARLTGPIPSELFKNKPLVTVFYRTFRGCRSLSGTIPHDLFADNPAVRTFSGVFSGCSGLTGDIPADLFSHQTGATNFADTFSGCLGLTGEIPHDLFASNPSVTNFDHTFGSCRNLTGSIPYDLFSLHPRVTTFWGTFQDCIGLTGEIPSNLFANNPSVTNFAHTFMGCTGFSGDAPALWTTHPSASGRECFKDCSGLQNYDEIPSGWK